MVWYHGTTKERLRSIQAHGLRKGSFVTPDIDVAREFARLRSEWNGCEPVILTGHGNVKKITLDRSGRRESQLTANAITALIESR